MKEQGSPGVRLKARRPWTKRELQLFLLALVFALFVVAFCYVPLLGWSIAFIDYNPGKRLSSRNSSAWQISSCCGRPSGIWAWRSGTRWR